MKILQKGFIPYNTRSLLNEFKDPFFRITDKLRQKFLMRYIDAVLISGNLIVGKFARWINDDCF